ncbi:2-dehydropantoate 2-reductase [Sphingomonas sp.]|uniref:ketopantoate reductase family protein n=1 Tax=Sphingomonas sp. TaxID=28214 RepID=UPI00180FD790|nr:2-dehydropantoate 2-reductase [Sphingomonas sp.]MBA3512335.1 2-dehydropantoate 2-reductase [Sphingomonas sp.]
MSAAERPRIVVVGAGAIGGWIGAKLALAGQSVSMLARGETLEALRRDGLRLTEGAAPRTAEVNASDQPAQLGPQDLLVIAVKAPALADAAEAARPMIGPDTMIVPMLNGVPWWFIGEPLASVDPVGRIAAALAQRQVIGSVVHAACSRPAANQVVVKHADRLILGEPEGGAGDRIEALAKLFEQAGIAIERHDDIRRAIWYKLWGNATINPLSALTRSTADRLLADPALRAWMLEAMAELAAVGAAIGCPIAESGEDRMAVTGRLGAFKTSMLQDVEAGRPIELEALLGAPREIASSAGVPTPQLDRLYALTRLLAENLGLL